MSILRLNVIQLKVEKPSKTNKKIVLKHNEKLNQNLAKDICLTGRQENVSLQRGLYCKFDYSCNLSTGL